jgi:DNA-binding transcriptional LysR family regulator
MRHLRIFQYVDEVARTGSIRKAAARLNVTASAVNRRIIDLEAELGAKLLERKPRGVRLTAAGEIFIGYVRQQGADVERMKSHIEDLKGLRRGTVRIACSQAIAFDFLPQAVAAYRARHPDVSFVVKVLDHERAAQALADYEVDLILVFRPPPLVTLQPLARIEQRLVALMAQDHPLAARPTIRLRDCAAYPIALADRGFGGRQLLDEVCARANLRLRIVAESNSFEFLRNLVRDSGLMSFQIEIGTEFADREGAGLVRRTIDGRDIPRADLVLGQLRGRNLPVPCAVFAEELTRKLEEMTQRPGRGDKH